MLAALGLCVRNKSKRRPITERRLYRLQKKKRFMREEFQMGAVSENAKSKFLGK